jgi:hypothetical protein
MRRRLLVGGIVALALYSLLGFFLAPWLVHKQAVAVVSAKLGAELRLQRVAVNPFTLSLTVNGLELDDRSGAPVARIEQIYANIQLNSIFRRVWTFGNLRLDVPQLHLSRDRDGGVSLARLTADIHKPETPGEQAALPRLVIHGLAINRGMVHWRDEFPAETVEHEFGPVTVEILDLSTLADQTGQQAVKIVTENSGTLSWQGSLQLGNARITGSHFDLVSDYIRHQAGLEIVRGDADVQFDYSVSVQSDGAVAATVEHFEFALTDVLVRTFAIGTSAEPDAQRDLLDLPALNLAGGRFEWPGRILSAQSLELDGARLSLYLNESDNQKTTVGARWDRLTATSLDYSALHNRLSISSLRLDKPYLDIVISEEGEVNLAGVRKVQPDQSSDADASVEEESEHGSRTDVIVGRVVIAEAGADFTDLSRLSPFSSSITGVNGEFSKIATNSSEPSSISLEGTLDEFGLFRVRGNFMPAAPADNTELNVVLKNVDLPRFSAYSVPLVGREISAGKVDLELKYQVTDKRLSGENAILLREFELGEKIPHPDAASLPLDLFVALLRDSNGDIEIDLPVRGNLDDPSVTVGGLVAKEMAGLVFKIATSPFALLGKLIGVSGNDLEFVEFDAGRVDLTPPAMETVARLAEVLVVRPELVLVVPGVYELELDGVALREAQLDAAVRGRIDSAGPTDDKQSTYLTERSKVLETLFLEQSTHEDPQSILVKIRSRNTSKAETPFDPIAYAADLRRELIGMQTLRETALTDLALERAMNLKVAVAAQDAALIGRVEITGTREVGEDQNAISMPIEFRARSD